MSLIKNFLGCAMHSTCMGNRGDDLNTNFAYSTTHQLAN